VTEENQVKKNTWFSASFLFCSS